MTRTQVDRRSSADAIARTPLWMHAVALAVLLLVMLPAVGTSASFSSDEGAYIFEAQQLSEDGSWGIPHPLAQADPEGEAFPLALAQDTDDGWVAVGKHPVYSVVLAVGDRVGGVDAMVLLSLLGTMGCATAAALLGRRLQPGLAVPAFWLVGVGSPLFFDGYLVMAHTLAAAACGFAFLVALRSREQSSISLVLALGALAAIAVVLRREAIVFVGALALVFLVEGVRRRHGAAILVACVAAGSALLAVAGERIWYRAIVPATSTTPDVPVASSGSVGGRIDGFLITWFQPGYAPFETRHVLLLVMALLGAGLIAAARLRAADTGLLAVLGGGVAVVAVVLVVGASFGPVSGLLVACPAILYGLVALRSPTGETALALCVAGIFAIGVAATQYDRGGALEWGGRYFALAVPVAIPALLVGLRRLLVSLDRPGRIAIVGALAASSLATSWLAIGALREAHRRHDATVSDAASLAAETAPGDGGAPVVVAGDYDLGRLAWRVAGEDSRWLYAEDLEELVPGLRAAGIDRFVYIANDRDGSEAESSGLVVVSSVAGGRIQELAFDQG